MRGLPGRRSPVRAERPDEPLRILAERVRDELGDAGPGRIRGHGARESDHPPPRATVRDDHRALDPQEGRSAGRFIVEDLPDAPDPGAQEQVRELAPDAPPQLRAPQVEDEGRQALEELDHDVAGHRIGHHDVGEVGDKVLALDVPDETQAGDVEQLGRSLDSQVALALLLADGQEGDARLRNAHDALREDRAHPRELHQVLRRGIRVGADVEEDERPAGADHLDGKRRAIDTRQPPDSQNGGRHGRAGVARGHDRVGPPDLDEVARHRDRRVLLLAQGEGGVLMHLDDLARRNDLDVRRELARDLGDPRAVADEQHAILGMGPGVIERAGNDLGRPVVATHGVDRERDPAGAGGGVHVLTASKECLPSGP
jgi:hypothetical protein